MKASHFLPCIIDSYHLLEVDVMKIIKDEEGTSNDLLIVE
jgi:hypothetical protein